MTVLEHNRGTAKALRHRYGSALRARLERLRFARPERCEWRAYGVALLIVLGSRLVVLFALYCAAHFLPMSTGPDLWDINSSWYRYLMRFDTGWYLTISQQGYSYNGDDTAMQNVVFFPLYPLISRFVQRLLGGSEAAPLIVANLALLPALLLLFKLVKDDYGVPVARWTVAFISLFPTAIFFSAGYTESLALLLIIGFFLCLRRQRYALAAVCAGLATASRFPCIVLLLPLWWELWRNRSPRTGRRVWAFVAYSVVASAGLWLFMLYLWLTFRHPLAFMTGQRAWQSNNDSLRDNLVRALTLQPAIHLTAIYWLGPTPNTLDPWFFLLFLCLIILFSKRLPGSYTIFALAALLLPYLARTGSSLGFASMTRYLLLAFPVFNALGMLSARRRWLGLCIALVFAALLFMYSEMFARWYWAG